MGTDNRSDEELILQLRPDYVYWYKQFDRVGQENRALEDLLQGSHTRIKELELQKFKRFNDEDCWMYQGDEDDNLESLVCPVVISASELIKLKGENVTIKSAVENIREYAETNSLYDHGYEEVLSPVLSMISSMKGGE